jgi:multimeric flavodoxin WrbA
MHGGIVMKIVSIFGSPRKKGNTAKVLNWVEDELRSLGHEVERVNTTDYTVNPCLECYTCTKKPDEPGCPQKDDCVSIMNKMIAADAILYASPLFCWSWSAQIKPLIDRHFCLVTGAYTADWKSLIAGKRTGLVMTSGGPVESNADLAVKQFEALMNYTRTTVKGTLVEPLMTTPDAIGEEARQRAIAFARNLVG